jgi:hypothetical protein
MNNPGNFLGIVVLALWVPLTFVLFARLKPALAGVLAIVGGVLFLPEQVSFNLPIFPDLDKVTIPVLTTIAATFIFARRKISETKAFEGIDAIFLVIPLGDVGMWLTNGDPLVSAASKTVRLPLGAYEFVGQVVIDVMVIYGTFFAGRMLFSRMSDLIVFVRVTFVFGLIYAGFALVELRFSPQLHTWVYGFMQSDFAHAARAGGYRPMVFLQQGLVFARFMAIALLSGLLLWRLNLLGKKGLIGLAIATAIFSVCKSLGALILFLAMAPLVTFASAKTQARVLFVLAVIVASYPIARGLDWVPVDDMLDLAASIEQQRADSMRTRFDNEADLLERARERLWFGWGGFGRSLLQDEYGKVTSIVDGEWIGVIGYRGIVGYVGHYGLFLLPIFLAVRRLRALHSPEHAILLGGFAIITTLLAIDTIPNATSNLPHFFWSGALAGVAQGFTREDQRLRRNRQRERKERLAAAADPAAA